MNENSSKKPLSVRNTLRTIVSCFRSKKAFKSADYWEQRYRVGGNLGSGSYGLLAGWKADFINDLVSKNAIERVLELGSGDGNQLSLARYPKYMGFDVSETSINRCKKRFSDRDWSFHVYSPENFARLGNRFRPQLVMSLDVIYHLIEDDVYSDHMKALFHLDSDFVVIYSSNGNMTVQNAHVRDRRFTDWISIYAAGWALTTKIENPYPWDPKHPDDTSFANFYLFQKRQKLLTTSSG